MAPGLFHVFFMEFLSREYSVFFQKEEGRLLNRLFLAFNKSKFLLAYKELTCVKKQLRLEICGTCQDFAVEK